MRHAFAHHLLLALITAPVASFAQGPRDEVIAVEPRALGGGAVAFGPVQFLFPAGWSFRLSGTLSEGRDGRGTKAYVSVLTSTDKSSGDRPLTGEQLTSSRQEAAALTEDLCGPKASSQIDTIRRDASAVIYASGCDEKGKDRTTFVVRYDIYSRKGVVQVTFAGLGAYAKGRAQLDAVARSYAW